MLPDPWLIDFDRQCAAIVAEREAAGDNTPAVPDQQAPAVLSPETAAVSPSAAAPSLAAAPTWPTAPWQAAAETFALALPGGATWHLRTTPDPARYLAWAANVRIGHVTAETWALLLAAYDAGWDVRDASGNPVPSPAAVGAGFAQTPLPLAVANAIGDWIGGVVAAAQQSLADAA